MSVANCGLPVKVSGAPLLTGWEWGLKLVEAMAHTLSSGYVPVAGLHRVDPDGWNPLSNGITE